MDAVTYIKRGQNVNVKPDVDTILLALTVNKAMKISNSGKTRNLANLHGTFELPFTNPHSKVDNQVTVQANAYCPATDEAAITAKIKADELLAAQDAAKAARG